MKSGLLIAFLCLTLCGGIGHQPRDTLPTTTSLKGTAPNSKASYPAGETNYQKSPKTQSAPRIKSLKDPDPKSKKDQGDPTNKSDSFAYKLSLWATVFGVFIGLGGLYFIWKQSKVTKSSVEGFKNSERAWLIVDIQSTEKSSGGAEFTGPGSTRVYFSNYGKSPAKIKQVLVRSDRLQRVSDLDSLSLSEDDMWGDMENTLVGPTKPLERNYFIPIETIRVNRDAGQETVFIWGVVCYTDIYNRPWYTRFLYKCSPRMYREPILVEPTSYGWYNKHDEGDRKKATGNPPSKPANI